MVIHVEHPWLILAKKTFSLECYIKEHKNMSIAALVTGKASLKRLLIKDNILAFIVLPPCLTCFPPQKEQAFLT